MSLRMKLNKIDISIANASEIAIGMKGLVDKRIPSLTIVPNPPTIAYLITFSNTSR